MARPQSGASADVTARAPRAESRRGSSTGRRAASATVHSSAPSPSDARPRDSMASAVQVELSTAARARTSIGRPAGSAGSTAYSRWSATTGTGARRWTKRAA